MDNKIDLDSILEKYERTYSKDHAKIKGSPDYNFKEATKEAIRQALVLASENASISGIDDKGKKITKNSVSAYYTNGDFMCDYSVDKKSILDVIDLVV